MASKQSASTSTFMVKEQGLMPPLQNTAHGNSDVITSSAPSYAVPKYVTDVEELISASGESRRMFLMEVTRMCLETAKKDRASNQMTSSQPTTNTTSTSTRTVFNISISGDTATKPVTAVYNTSGAEMKRRIEDGRPNQAVTLFAPVGVAEDLSKTQYLLCGEIKQELKLLGGIHSCSFIPGIDQADTGIS